MTSPKHGEVFARLRKALTEYVRHHSDCEIEYQTDDRLLLRFGAPNGRSSLLAMVGWFELYAGLASGWDYEALEDDRDVERVLAICDAILSGRGVSISGPNGYPARAWLFLNSRGFKQAMTSTTVSIRSCRRARSIGKSAWRREKLPVLTSTTA
ncbi:MAG TPA: hypothetical protein VF122_00970 [Caulobacteraceae bacterium]